MIYSNEISELFTAFLKAKREFKPLLKTGYNPFFKSYYSRWEDYLEACGDAFDKYGLLVTGGSDIIDGQFIIEVQITHAPSNQWMRSIAPISPHEPGPQPIGGWISYLKRYMLSTMLGIGGSEEDDGNANQEYYKSTSSNSTKITPEQVRELQDLIKNHSQASKIYKDILSFNKVDQLENLTYTAFNGAKSYISKLKTS